MYRPTCSIAVVTEGKYAILTPELLERLMELLEHNDSEIRLNSIKLLSLLAESPKGKESLKSALNKVSKSSGQDQKSYCLFHYTVTRIGRSR